MFLAWFDPDKHVDARSKALTAMARYKRRWLLDAAVVVCNPAQVVEIGDLGEGVEVRGAQHCGLNVFMVGHDEPG